MTENPYAAPAFDPRASSDLTELMPILQGVQWPLRMSFKIITFAPTVRIHDATGRLVVMVRQKFFKLREHVEIFADEQRTQKVAEIRANKIIDWSARYSFTEPDGRPIGSTQRQGMRSLWRASYDVYNPGDETPDFHIRETNPMAKFFDGLVGSIPLLGLLTLYLFHPSYSATRLVGDVPVMKLTKQPAFLEGRFLVEKLAPSTDRETLNLILSFFMLSLMERRRG